MTIESSQSATHALTPASTRQRPVLVVGHPGHELAIFDWLRASRAIVNVLTDGSGRDGRSRMPSTLKVLQDTAAGAGSLLGALTDAQFYEAVLRGDVAIFVDVAVRLGDDLSRHAPPYVVGDAREGFNPTHDVCRLIIDAAVARARRNGTQLENYEFSLFASHTKQASEAREHGICRVLDDEAFRRKLSAARAYPELASEVEWAVAGTTRHLLAKFPELAAMVDAAIEGMNEESFATECLVPVRNTPPSDRPFYELYGERLVAAGTYARAIRYRDHVQPIEHALATL